MPIHYIDVKQRRAATFDCADPIPQAGEIGGQDGRSNFNRIIHNFSADMLPDSQFCSHLVTTRNEKSCWPFSVGPTVQPPSRCRIRSLSWNPAQGSAL